MADDFIGIDVSGVEEITTKLNALDDAVADNGVETANTYFIEVEKQYAPSHKGEPFKWTSDAQRRAAFARMRAQGGPPYRRTQELRRGWRLLGSGRNQIIVNEVPYARYVKDPPIPGHALRQWTSVEQDLEKSNAKLLDKFDEGVRKGIKKVGLE